ncbi:MAG: cytochrome c biogenesis protein CcdA [Cyclobacteriaceae bacterium]
MKRLYTLLLTLFTFSLGLAQVPDDHTSWDFTFSKETLSKGDQVDVIIKVDIADNWYIYSIGYKCDPLPTTIVFEENPDYQLIGSLKAVGDKVKKDEIFGCKYRYFSHKGTYTQKVEVLANNPSSLSGTYDYQTCTESQCIPFFGNKFSIETAGGGIARREHHTKTVQGNNLVTINSSGSEDESSKQYSVDHTACKRKAGLDDIVVNRFSKEVKKPKNFITLLLFAGISFLVGLGALLTPCVFPMIPMTVSFFTSNNSSRSSAIRTGLLYGFFIVFIYTLLGTLIAYISGPGFANWLATSWVTNILFFVVFILFGLSFLGLFEITLPNKFINSVDQQSEKGGILGIFFMSFTLVLVSFSCTGPLVGTILIESAGGEWRKPIAGMLGYSTAFAVPFALFAIFPSWLSRLPKSGGWLNSVKVIFGLLELALAFKFLSVADQAYHWHLLSRDTFLVIWIAIFGIMFLYLIGKITLSHDSKLDHLGVPRLLFAIATLAFTIYMIPGLWGAPLKFLSGILPPKTTTHFSHTPIQSDPQHICEEPLYGDQLHLPLGLSGYFDIRQAICCAKEQNKPLFIDVTGHGCTNCRQMEASVWSDPQVLEKLKSDFVILAMYADDRIIELPIEEQYTNSEMEKISMMRELNNDFLLHKFGIHAQPYYLILEANQEGELIILNELTDPHQYNLDTRAFLSFLDNGLTNFKTFK